MAENKRVLKAYDGWRQEKKTGYDALCVLHRELFRRVAVGEASEEIVAIQGDLEAWLEENIEEVVQPWT